jgi:hypothetical protein
MRILLTMQTGESVKVDKVDMVGQVDGMQLQPQAAKVDTTRRDTTATRPGKPVKPGGAR